jgi:hypothetical protein
MRTRPLAVLVIVILVGSALTRAGTGASAYDGTPPGAVEAWPGGSAVATASVAGQFGTDLSGLAYEPAAPGRSAILWAVRNDPATLYRLERRGGDWIPATTGGWSAGMVITNPGNSSSPDAEAVAITDAGSAGGVYVASERSNSYKQVSSLRVLRYDVSGSSGSIIADRVWDLTRDLPVVDANQGLESIAWVPDTALTAGGLVDQRTGAPYVPSAYPGHGDGLFFVGLERVGIIYGYALDHTSGAFHRITTIEPTPAGQSLGAGALMELQYDADRDRLWASCDNGCQGRSATYEIAASGSRQGRFALSHVYRPPTGLPNANDEGFAFAPDAECAADGTKPVWWADDDQSGGYAIREGTLSCVPPAAPTPDPTEQPTEEPTEEPTEQPTEEPTEQPTEEPTGPTPTATGPTAPAERFTTTARIRLRALPALRVRVRLSAAGLAPAALDQRAAVSVAGLPRTYRVRLRDGVWSLRLPRTEAVRGNRTVRLTVVVDSFTATAPNGATYDVGGTVTTTRVTLRGAPGGRRRSG